MFEKRNDYERYGIGEYLVMLIREARAVWFTRSSNMSAFVEIAAGNDGILRSPKFPGLWLDASALFRGDRKRVNDVLNLGLASPEHAAFVAK